MRRVAAWTIVILLAACSGNGEPETSLADTASLVSDLGIDTVEVLGPDEEEPVRAPQFEWEAVDGADSYVLVVLSSDGSPVWSWEGVATNVWMGGHGVELPSGLATPVATPGSSWTVVALDDGVPVAISDRRALNGTGVLSESSGSPSDAGADTPTTEAASEDEPELLEVCGAVDPDAVRAVTGPGVSGTSSDLVVGDELIGRSCDIGGGFTPVLTLGVYTGSIDSWVGRCDVCEDYAGLGDEASGGVGVAGNGQEVGALYVNAVGLTFRAETQGVPVTLELLDALIRSLIDAHS